jgi:hypothetical protein
MTYTVLETFKSLFFSSGEKYLSDGNVEVGVPLASNYSKHLSGDCRLFVSTENTRFSIAEIKSGILPKDTPLVEFRRGRMKYVCLFLRDKYTDAFIQLKRVADYYNIKIEKPEYYELPFFCATLDFAPVDDSGKKFDYIEDALQYCYKKSLTIKNIDFWEKGLPYSEAPFCVQSFYLIYNKLPSFANPYLDAKGLPIENKSDAEWWKRNTAPMDCTNCWCNAEKCAGRRYGFTGNELSELEFGELVQYAEEPVYYEWTVNGSTLRFDNEIDIIHQDRFLRLCMRSLGVLPRKLKNSVWLRIINKALSNMVVVGKENSAKLNIDNLNKIIVEDLKDRVLVSSYLEYERLMQGYIYLDPATSNFIVHASAFCSYLTGRYKDIRVDSMSEFYSVMKHLGFKVRNGEVDGYKCSFLYVRSRYLFKSESDWKEYMLDVSKDTMWEENFRAFLLGEDVEQEDIPNEIKEEILDSATVFLDTEKDIR